MKKILYLFSGLIFFSITACEDEEKNPYPESIENGAFVRLEEVISPVVDVSNPDAGYTVRLTDPADNVAEYNLQVSWTRADGETVGPVDLVTVTEFPTDLVITGNDLATAFGVDFSEITPGDAFNFNAEVVGDNGQAFTSENLGPDLAGNQGQAQGFQFLTFASCPFVAANMEGTYTVVQDDFEVILDDEFEIVAGPEENQFTMVDVFGHGFDVVVNVDPETGVASMPTQESWDPQAFGMPDWYGDGYTGGDGFAFSCAGISTFALTFTVDAGSFGSGYTFTVSRAE